MVFQIYFGERGMDHNVLFDIEVYLNKEERLGGDWYSEIISSAFGSAFTNYFFSVNIQELIDKGSYISDMVKDAKELEELRGWLYEIANFFNTPINMTLASERHKKVVAYVKEKVYAFADKYNLNVNED
jgi:hypothetical protein